MSNPIVIRFYEKPVRECVHFDWEMDEYKNITVNPHQAGVKRIIYKHYIHATEYEDLRIYHAMKGERKYEESEETECSKEENS